MRCRWRAHLAGGKGLGDLRTHLCQGLLDAVQRRPVLRVLAETRHHHLRVHCRHVLREVREAGVAHILPMCQRCLTPLPGPWHPATSPDFRTIQRLHDCMPLRDALDCLNGVHEQERAHCWTVYTGHPTHSSHIMTPNE